MGSSLPSPRTHRWAAALMAMLLAPAYFFVLVQTMGAQDTVPIQDPAAADAGPIVLTDTYSHLPAIFTPPPQLVLNAIPRPNSANQWLVSWSDGGPDVTNYELQESPDSGFATPTTYNTGTATFHQSGHPPSTANHYYYRVRANGHWGDGFWSNVQTVRGGYRDDFSDPNSGWAMRRTTFLKRIVGYYENGSFIVIVDDRWDWGLFSPLVPAPEPPYVIEYVSRVHDPANLVSHGVAYGGDWNGQPCPDYSTFDGVYKHDICFNHFYNHNFIWYGPLKMVFERVDYLYWCADVPKCSGDPPLKRALGYAYETEVLPDGSAGNWHTWRVEVRQDGIRMYVDGALFSQTTDTTFVNGPYFGLFASTDEYKPSIFIVDYFQVTYLDQ